MRKGPVRGSRTGYTRGQHHIRCVACSVHRPSPRSPAARREGVLYPHSVAARTSCLHYLYGAWRIY